MMWSVIAINLFLLVSPAIAQSGSGTISGTIKDPDKNAVVGALVFAKNTTTGTLYKTNSARNGTFTIPNLPAGTYELSVPTVGFTLDAQTKKDLAVRAGQTLNVDMLMVWAANLGTVGDDTFLTIRNRY